MAGIILNRSRQVPAEDTPAFGGIAERFRRAGDLDRAIALCRDGLKKFPNQLSARVTLGWSLLDKGQYDEARAELERVLRRAPDNLAAIRGLAELHDRSEGALPSMDDRDIDGAALADASAESAAPIVASNASRPASSPAPAPPQDIFAPIAISLASATAEPSPEILHTAEDAGRAARDAALAAAAAALLGVESANVQVEGPAAAAMAASASAESGADAFAVADESFALDAQFDAGAATFDATPPVLASPADLALEEAAQADEGVELIVDARAGVETPAEWTLSETEPAEAFSVAFSEPAAHVAAETDDLVAALQSLSESDASTEPALVLETSAMSADSVDVSAELAAFEETLALESPAAAAFETIEPEAAELESLTSLLSTDPELNPDAAVAALAGVEDIAPQPAFVPDLAIRLESHEPVEASGLLAGLPESVDVVGKAAPAPVALGGSEADFVPDLSAVAFEDAPFELQPPPFDTSEPGEDDRLLELLRMADQEADASSENLAFHFEDRVAEAVIEPVDIAQDVVLHADAAVDMPEAEVTVAAVAAEAVAGEGAALVSPFAALTAASIAIEPVATPAAQRSALVLASLERFLRQVESRRLQLSTESVA